MGFWVYIARCGDNTLYTGSTTDLNRRIKEHNNTKRGARYTNARLPIKLECAWKVFSWGDALRLEKAIKKCKKLDKEGLILTPEKIMGLAEKRELDFKICLYSLDISDFS